MFNSHKELKLKMKFKNLILVLIALSLSSCNNYVDHQTIDLYFKVCKGNGGVKFAQVNDFKHDEVYCNNGAVFFIMSEHEIDK